MLTLATVLAVAIPQAQAVAQHMHAGHDGPTLHVNTRWKECSFQLSSALTQAAWRQFTEEAGLVVYFRSLTDARPMGRGKFEVSLLQWETGIDDADAAWNDTFVHPDSSHWLFEGSRLQFPGLTMRAGLGAKTDAGFYVTKSPGANYGFYGGQLQRSIAGDSARAWAAAARASFVSMYGPEDLDFTVYGMDLVASRRVSITRRIAVSPYVSVATYLATSHEKSAVVTLDDERVLGAQAMVGTVAEISGARLAVEYSVAKVPTFSLKIGVAP
jgi:hypothetical protein